MFSSCAVSRWVAAAPILLASCAFQQKPATVERVAVLPLENLTGDPSLDWWASAVSQQLASLVPGAETRHVFAASSAADGWAGAATNVVRGYLSRRGGRTEAHAVLLDATGHAVLRESSVSVSEKESPAVLAFALGQALLGGLRTSQRPPPVETLRLLHQAEAVTDSAERSRLLARAVELAPSYAPAQVALARMKAAQGDRSGAVAVVKEAQRSAAGAPDAARLRLAEGELTGNLEMRAAALDELSRAFPADAEAANDLGEIWSRLGRFDHAAAAYERAQRANPESIRAWNDGAYHQAATGRVDAAAASIGHYAKLQPRSANPLDSLGEIYYMKGRFGEAEKAFLDAHAREPSFFGGVALRKAAESLRAAGDLDGANKRFEEYAAAAKAQPNLELFRAQWEYGTGRRDAGVARVASLAARQPLAGAQQAIWLVADGKRAQGAEAAKRALTSATSQRDRLIAFMAAFVSQPHATPEEWRARANKSLGAQGALKNLLLAYALLLDGHHAAAVPVLNAARSGMPLLEGIRIDVPRAWAMIEAGKFDEAAKLPDLLPVPQTTGDAFFEFLHFPRVFDVRSKLLERAGKAKEAGELAQRYAKLTAR